MMNFDTRVRFTNAYFNALLSSQNVSTFALVAHQDGTVDFGTFDGKFFKANVPFRNVVIAIMEQLFSYVTLQDFARITQNIFAEYSIPSFYAVINTKPFGNQKYFEKKYYIVECETDKNLQLEVTQIGKKTMKCIGFIVQGEKKQEFTDIGQLLPFFINLYVQVLCDIL